MKIVGSVSLLLLLFTVNMIAQTPRELAEIWEKHHISKTLPSDVHHRDLQAYLEQLKKAGLKVDEVGRSNANREIYQVEYGKGPLRVFMWSQMHGDEPTATSALIDMLAFLQKEHKSDLIKKIAETVTIRAVPMLKAAGGGSIVNMSSAAGHFGYAFRTPYSAAKFGVIGFTESLAKELGPHNIRVNAIRPGIVEGARMTNVIRARAAQVSVSDEEMERQYLSKVSLRRMVSPHDVAAMIAFLLSNAGANISGQSIGVDGNVETL